MRNERPEMSETLLNIYLHEASKQNERAEVGTFSCCLPGGPEMCPLFQKGECLSTSVIHGSNCLYGKEGYSESATKRAQSYYKFVTAARAQIAEEKAKGLPQPKYTSMQLVKIGEYVVFPNGQITMCEAVPFVAHGGFFRTGRPWLKEEDFTVENLLRLVNFRPQALMGGEITTYQKEEVPRLLLQLKFRFPEMFAAVIEAAPELAERVPNPEKFVGATLNVTKFPSGLVTLKFGTREKPVTVEATWDGEKLTATLDGTARTWLMDYNEAVTVTFTPKENVKAVVTEEKAPDMYEAGLLE